MTTNNTPTIDFANMNETQLRAALEQSVQENVRLKTKGSVKTGSGTVSMKVSPKGAISVYGIGSFPVSLYEPQWKRLLEQADAIRAFIAKAAADGALPNEEQVAAGKAAAKLARDARAAAKKAG